MDERNDHLSLPGENELWTDTLSPSQNSIKLSASSRLVQVLNKA